MALRSELLMDDTVELPLDGLETGLSPRLTQPDPGYVRTLADVFEQLPPITVHAGTNRVVDGTHRIRAATLLGLRTIRARMFEGTDAEAALEAIRLNVAHGKPLNRAEREGAVARTLALQPELSDRRIAALCGVSAATVSNARRHAGSTAVQVERRIGRDGRARNIDIAAARERIAADLAGDPTRSDREIARRTRTSAATVRDVRARLARGEAVVPTRLRFVAPPLTEAPAMRADADLSRFADWLSQTAITDRDWVEHVGDIPTGRIYEVIDEARRRAESWSALAHQLELRVRRLS
jgi:ParB-like chromosome segregation protein Spo0J